LREVQLTEFSAAVKNSVDRFVVHQAEHTIPRGPHVKLTPVGASLQGSAERIQRILRREFGRSAVNHDHDPLPPLSNEVQTLDLLIYGGLRICCRLRPGCRARLPGLTIVGNRFCHWSKACDG
jgi:hypothetical protein